LTGFGDKEMKARTLITTDKLARARACFAAGRVQLKLKECTAAEISFGQALYFDSTVSTYHYYQGLALEKQRRFKDAMRAFERALWLDPHNAKYLAKLNLARPLLSFPDKRRRVLKRSSMDRPHRQRPTCGREDKEIKP
jgi:tetratricopeptide (TPR) repeat protein